MPPATQTSPPGKAHNIKLKTQTTPETKKAQAEFAERLKKLMEDKGMSQSALAREVWGTTKDARGYEVARNRDRISSYLAGIGMPEADNVKKIAEVLECTVEDLMGAEGLTRPLTKSRGVLDSQMVIDRNKPTWVQMQINAYMPLSKALQLWQLYLEAVAETEKEEAVELLREASKQ